MDANPQAWYRQGWPWVLILIPFSAVLFGIVMISTVVFYPDDLVADDYYKDGMAINRLIEMDEHAVELGIVARLVSVGDGAIEFDIDGAADSAVVLNIYHVTDRDKDQQILLVPMDGGHYGARGVADLGFASRGIWYLALEGIDGHWRIRTRVVAPLAQLEINAR